MARRPVLDQSLSFLLLLFLLISLLAVPRQDLGWVGRRSRVGSLFVFGVFYGVVSAPSLLFLFLSRSICFRLVEFFFLFLPLFF